MDNDAASAATHANVLKSGDASSFFGNDYGSATEDPVSVNTGQASNPACKLSSCNCLHRRQVCLHACLVTRLNNFVAKGSSSVAVRIVML